MKQFDWDLVRKSLVYPDLLDEFITNGVNHLSEDGMNALMAYSRIGSDGKLVKLFVEAGIDVNALNKENISALIYA